MEKKREAYNIFKDVYRVSQNGVPFFEFLFLEKIFVKFVK